MSEIYKCTRKEFIMIYNTLGELQNIVKEGTIGFKYFLSKQKRSMRDEAEAIIEAQKPVEGFEEFAKKYNALIDIEERKQLEEDMKDIVEANKAKRKELEEWYKEEIELEIVKKINTKIISDVISAAHVDILFPFIEEYNGEDNIKKGIG